MSAAEGRSLKNWTETVKNDLRGLELSWGKAEELAMDIVEWRLDKYRSIILSCTQSYLEVASKLSSCSHHWHEIIGDKSDAVRWVYFTGIFRLAFLGSNLQTNLFLL